MEQPAPLLPEDRWLGPYRVLRPLGRGGMGEILLAEDPRLGRRVAIKRLHPAEPAGDDPERIETRRVRFRREARTLAKLRHPAIVQVYELLSVDGEDHLVMEYVEGANLRQVIERLGPLPAEEVVVLARRLAEGLDHAHRNGIIHRDLKTENVLVDADGEPRLADFGLARSDPQRGPEEPRLTAEGRVLGTVRAMAPEQILGEPVDTRTDLFALGVLMVEALTGRSPFEAASRRATISRILGDSALPFDDVEMPAALAELIRHLLEKDPALRPRDAGEVARRLAYIATEVDETEVLGKMGAATASIPLEPAAPAASGSKLPFAPSWFSPVPVSWKAGLLLSGLLVLGLLAFGFVGRVTPQEPPLSNALHVAVLATEVRGVPEAEAEVLSFAVRSAALRGLSSLDRVVASKATDVDAVARNRTPQQVAHAMASDEVLTSEVRCDEQECWLELARLDGETGEMLWGAALQAPRAEPETLAWATEKAVAGGLAAAHRERHPALPPQLLAELLELRLADGQDHSRLDPQATYERLEELRRRFGPSAELDRWRALVASWAYTASRDGMWRERALAALDAATAAAPDNPLTDLSRTDVELTFGHFEAAAATLRELESKLPGDVRVEELKARLWFEEGEFAKAIAGMQQVVARRPSWSRLYNLARMAAEGGAIDLALKTLETLEDRAPGNVMGRRLRASLELKFGDLDRAAEIYQALAAESPSVAVWSNLGVVHLLRRDAAAALRALESARDLAPDNALVLLNLADAHSLAGSTEVAADLYEQVVARLEAAAPTDPQALTTRAQARAHLGRASEAIADVEEAIRRAPEDASVRFEAALVYAVVGDLVSARRNRQRSRELGMEARWFSLTPFDVLG